MKAKVEVDDARRAVLVERALRREGSLSDAEADALERSIIRLREQWATVARASW